MSIIAWYAKTPKNDTSKATMKYFSVIIPARNEANNIAQCLDSILNQDYASSAYEIIVIDDYSQDETACIVKQYMQQHGHIQLIQLVDYPTLTAADRANKKAALAIAIDRSQYEWIVQTDADCTAPTTWLSAINGVITDNVHIIAGPVRMVAPARHSKYSVLHNFQSIDFMTMQLITNATHYYNIGRMSNGANMAFRKTTYQEVEGYKDITHIASGDDMLLLQKISALYPKGATYIKNESAIVDSDSQASWMGFLHQRIRWSSKAGHYTDKRLNWLLLIVYLVNISIPFSLILGIYELKYLHLSLLLLVLKTLIELTIVWPAAKFFNNRYQLWWFPFLQPLHIFYIIIAGGLGLVGKYKWKGRTINN